MAHHFTNAWLVEETNEDGRLVKRIGVATGDKKIIQEYYGPYVALTPVRLVHIDKQLVDEKTRMLEERETLMKRLSVIDATLGR